LPRAILERPEKAMIGTIVPEKDLHARCMVQASLLVETGQEPTWFREDFYGEGGVLTVPLVAKCGLSSRVLATLPLALLLSFETPRGSLASAIKGRLKVQRARLGKARRDLVLLAEESRPKGLKSSAPVNKMADGSYNIDLDRWEDPYQDIINAIDRFLELSEAGIADQGDGKKQQLYYAVERLFSLQKQSGRKLSILELEKLCQHLFDPVRERSRKRGKDKDIGGYSHALRRIAKLGQGDRRGAKRQVAKKKSSRFD
jgi:hypothetical protein